MWSFYREPSALAIDGGGGNRRSVLFQEGLEVGEGEFGGGGVAGFENVGEEGAFFVLEGEDFFFDGAGRDEFVARDDAGLADAVGTVGGLRFGGGIPPRVEVHDGVGGSEIEAGAAGFEGEEEDGDGGGRRGSGRSLETVDLGLAGVGAHRTVEVAVGDALFVEVGAEEGEKRGELGEDEEAVAVVEGFGEDFAEGVEFRGVVVGGGKLRAEG